MTRRWMVVLVAVAGTVAVGVSGATFPLRRERSTIRDGFAAGAKTVVVAELFTSEGCSSCPPADALLRQWSANQPVEGVEVIALGEHVDYWDRLGWRDPFSAAMFSVRQSAYDAAVFRSHSIYTPQLVVDGALQGVASDAGVVRRLLQTAAQQPKGVVAVTVRPAGPSAVRVDLQIQIPATVARNGPAEVVVAVTEDGLVTHVKRGENGGRTLSHSAVVRSMTRVGRLAAGDSTIATGIIPLKSDWALEHVRVVALVQEEASRRILAAGAAPALDKGGE